MRVIVLVMEMFIKYVSLYWYCRGNSLRRSGWKLRYFFLVMPFNSYVLFHIVYAQVRCVMKCELWGLPGIFFYFDRVVVPYIQWVIRFG